MHSYKKNYISGTDTDGNINDGFTNTQKTLQTKIELKQSLTDILTSKDPSSESPLNLSLFKNDYQSFIKIILDCVPEAKYLNTKANVSAEKQGEIKSEKNFYGLTEDEAIRGFSGLLRFKDVINHTEDDYKQFVNCQIEMKKPVLTKISFDKMKDYIMETLHTPEDFAAAMWSILCNDLGKVHAVIEEYKKIPESKEIGHDGLLGKILKKKPDFFPGFSTLSQKHQQQIILGYASGSDISMLEQLELPSISLKALSKLDKQTLDRYILHTIYDVSGAAAAFKSNGSLTMHEETWVFFNELRLILSQLHEAHPPSLEKIYQDYLKFRGNCVGIISNDRESLALIRIAGLSRLATLVQGELLRAAWKQLTKIEQEILIHELNIHGDKGQRAIFVGYGVAMLVNPQVALKPIYGSVVNEEGLKIGLKYLASAFKITREKISDDTSDQIFVAECDAIAKALSKNPREYINDGQLTHELQIAAISERRIDFILKPISKLELSKIGLFSASDISEINSSNTQQPRLK